MSETAGFFGFFKSLSTQHKSLLLSCYAVMFSQVCFPKRLLLTNFLIVPLLIPLLYDLAVLSHVFPFTIFPSTRGKTRSFRVTGLYSSDHHRTTNWTRREKRNNSNKAQQQHQQHQLNNTRATRKMRYKQYNTYQFSLKCVRSCWRTAPTVTHNPTDEYTLLRCSSRWA